MKLDKHISNYLFNVVRTAHKVGIESFIIEPGKVRALSDDRSVVIFTTDNVPDLPFESIGVNRISTLLTRQSLIEGQPFVAEVDIGTSPAYDLSFARSLKFKGDNIKVEYRCANPMTIVAPKDLTEKLPHHFIRMTTQSLQAIKKGAQAMETDMLKLVAENGALKFILSDNNGDLMEYQMGTSVDVNDKPSDFEFKYNTKKVLQIFNTVPDTEFWITSRGALRVPLNNLDVFLWSIA